MSKNSTHKTVGLIGLGLMGSALSRRLLDGGFNVVGFDIDPDKRNAFEKLGGEPVESIADVASCCRRVLIAVMTVAQVEDVVAEILKHPSPSNERRIVMSVATSEPDRIETLANETATKGLDFLDTPVSGTSKQVLDGDGHGLIGGDQDVANASADILDAIYPNRSVTGAAGSATKTKLAINHILGLNRVALAEGLVFAETLGLEKATFLDVAKKSAAYAQIMDVKGGTMVSGDFSNPVSKISQHLKDVRIMLSEAKQGGQPLPMLSTLAEVLEASEQHGDGDQDNAITINEIRRRKKP
jgi:3-hydroxyisobutyrate dehydrogenase-like beta-hydroxyacid dehydrogenase